MAALVSDIKAAIVTNLTAAGILAYPYARDQAVPPEAQVGMPTAIEYDTTYGRGVDRHLIPVRVYVVRADEENAQDELDEYVGTTGALSVKLIIEDPTGWTTVDPVAVRVMVAQEFGGYTLGGAELIGVEFLVEVHA